MRLLKGTIKRKEDFDMLCYQGWENSILYDALHTAYLNANKIFPSNGLTFEIEEYQLIKAIEESLYFDNKEFLHVISQLFISVLEVSE